MTFSILGYDQENKEFGIATCSAIPCIGEYFAFGDGSAGVVAAQGSCNPYNGLKSIHYLKDGVTPNEIIAKLKQSDELIQKRQIAIISNCGLMACYTGENLGNGVKGHIIGKNFIACGNTLEDLQTLEIMKEAFEKSNEKHLYLKLLHALKMGDSTKADIRGRQSAGLHVYSFKNDYPIIKINIDDDINPVRILEEKVSNFIKSFYKIIPFFPQRDGTQSIPEPDSIEEKIFTEFKKNVRVRNFHI
ncbi:DUF1028 domain-containing protein [Fluviispira sanaruensis]|uniref:DUF1028 domain-containing protein n=1 Tax=Fluviispira sanaruensis TaxID=2493639 RepID=A0A4P2VXK1_FLUSA|nr:DUF1028 domain-containing protein [Fluviispira sanaruensis]BBH54375.1 DUF1028 domain-containing protein [Fluviispira sanaruensis]